MPKTIALPKEKNRASQHADTPPHRTALPEEYRSQLIAQRSELRQRIGGVAADFSCTARNRGGSERTDLAQTAQEESILSGMCTSDAEALATVEAALDRMENGRFGICEECGRTIPLKRIKALRGAVTHCIRCALQQEH